MIAQKSNATLLRRKRDDAAFNATIEKGKARGIQEGRSALFEAALQGYVPAMIFYLKARAGWSDKPMAFQEGLPVPQLRIICPDGEGRVIGK